MATGISKNRWNGEELLDAQDDISVSLSYAGKDSEDTVMAIQPADLRVLHDSGSGLNRLIYGDNLPVLSRFCCDPRIRGKVHLVYIDPPFATGSVFKSRSQEDAYSDLRTGANYIEFLRKRLIFLRELLSDDGSIYVHLDSKMAFQIKVVMDEIFGDNNFRGSITRKKCNPKNYTRRTYGNISDYILFYTKTDNYFWERPYDVWTEEQAFQEYSYIEEDTGRRYKKVPIHAPGVRNGATGRYWRNMLPPEGKHWQYTPDRLDEMDANGGIYWSPNGNPRKKVYLDESSGKPVQDIWLDFKDAHNQNIRITGYPTEKNPELLARIIEASSPPDGLTLDCFAGSGTTLEVAHRLGRSWIGIDNSLHAIETILKRLAHGTKPMGDFVRKRGIPNPQQIALFDESVEESGQYRDLVPSTQVDRIPRFSLLSSVDITPELNEILSKWLESIRAIGDSESRSTAER